MDYGIIPKRKPFPLVLLETDVRELALAAKFKEVLYL